MRVTSYRDGGIQPAKCYHYITKVDGLMQEYTLHRLHDSVNPKQYHKVELKSVPTTDNLSSNGLVCYGENIELSVDL